MKVFIFQPNYSSVSEVWLRRMNKMLAENICGMACYYTNENIKEPYPVFNLNGRLPTKVERLMQKSGLQKKDTNSFIRSSLKKFISKCQPDLFLIQYATTAIKYHEILNAFNISVIIYVHGFDIIIDHNDNNGMPIYSSGYPQQVLEISKLPNVSFIVSSGTSRKNLIELGIVESKIKKKVFGVANQDIKRDYSKENLTILFLGRFVDFKGPDIVLQAFFMACEKGFKGNLIMAGDGPLRIMCELINKRSAYAGRVEFTGEVSAEEAARLFQQVDIYSMHNCYGLVSNGYDTFGVTIIEAMSFALPIITGDFGGPAELIENGLDGILIESGNIKAHADAFMLLYNDRVLAKKLGENGRQKASKTYSLLQEKKQLYSILGLRD